MSEVVELAVFVPTKNAHFYAQKSTFVYKKSERTIGISF